MFASTFFLKWLNHHSAG